MDERRKERKGQIVDFLAAAAKKGKRLDPGVIRVSQTIRGDHNTQILGNPIFIGQQEVIERKVVRERRVVQHAPDAITPAQAAELQQVVRQLVEASIAAGVEASVGTLYIRYWRKLKRRFRVNSYLEIKQIHFEAALEYLRRMRRITKARTRRTNPVYWRQEQYKAIYAHLHQLGYPKEYAYQLSFDRLGKYITSLKELSVPELQKLYNIVFELRGLQ